MKCEYKKGEAKVLGNSGTTTNTKGAPVDYKLTNHSDYVAVMLLGEFSYPTLSRIFNHVLLYCKAHQQGNLLVDFSQVQGEVFETSKIMLAQVGLESFLEGFVPLGIQPKMSIIGRKAFFTDTPKPFASFTETLKRGGINVCLSDNPVDAKKWLVM